MPDTEVWTTRKLLHWTTQHFEKHRLDAPRVRAEMLLGHVFGVPRLRLYMDPDRPAAPDELAAMRDLVKRAAASEPLDYLIGHTTFFSLEFRVTPAVLVPRPSTETLVEFAMQTLRVRDQGPGIRDQEEHVSREFTEADVLGDAEEPQPDPRTPNPGPLHLADVGTGSGVIAITLLKHLPHATAVATDVSEDALHVAQQNADKHGVADRIEFRHGDGLGPLRNDERFDALLSNPPYIPDHQWPDVPADVKDHEPTLALRGGPDGLDVLRPLIADARHHVKPAGLLAFEIAAVQAEQVRRLAADAGWADVEVLPDHERLPRVLVGRA
jgi:release factor glutamine methyltransferase